MQMSEEEYQQTYTKLKEALQVLYNPNVHINNTPKATKLANEYLLKFRRLDISLFICKNILHSDTESIDVKIFASQVVLYRIRKMNDIDYTIIDLNEILSLALRYCKEKPIRVQLCLTICSLLMKINTPANMIYTVFFNCVEQLSASAGTNLVDNNNHDDDFIKKQLIEITLNVLEFLAQEVTNKEISIKRDKKQAAINFFTTAEASQIVLEFIHSISSTFQVESICMHTIKALKTLCSANFIQGDQLIHFSFLSLPFQVINSGYFYEICFELLTSIVEAFGNQDRRFINILMPNILLLGDLLKAKSYEENLCTQMSEFMCIFGKIGLSSMFVVMEDDNDNDNDEDEKLSSQEKQKNRRHKFKGSKDSNIFRADIESNLFYKSIDAFISIMLELFQNGSHKIIPVTFDFWESFGERMVSSSQENRNNTHSYGENTLMQVIKVVIVRTTYFEGFESLCSDSREEFVDFREEIRDFLRQISFGSLVVSIEKFVTDEIDKIFQQTADKQQWQYIESLIHCLSANGTLLQKLEYDKEYRPLHRIFEILPVLPHHPALICTTTLLIGVMARYICGHPQYFASALQVIASSLSFPGKEDEENPYPCISKQDHVASVILLKFSSIGGSLFANTDGIFDQIANRYSGIFFEYLEDERTCIMRQRSILLFEESLLKILSHYPIEQLSEKLILIASTYFKQLEYLKEQKLTNANDIDYEDLPRKIEMCLKSLNLIVKYSQLKAVRLAIDICYQNSAILSWTFQNYFHEELIAISFTTILKSIIHSHDCCISTSRALSPSEKSSVSESFTNLFCIFGPQIVEAHSRKPYACYLNVMKSGISSKLPFDLQDRTFIPWSDLIFNQTIPFVKSFDQSDPDLIESFLKFSQCIITKNPYAASKILQINTIVSIFEIVYILLMGLQHREAGLALLSFISDVHTNIFSELEIHQRLRHIIIEQNYGQEIVLGLLIAVTGTMPSWMLDDIVTTFYSIYDNIGKTYFHPYIVYASTSEKYQRSHVSQIAKDQFYRELEASHDDKNFKKFKVVLKRFSGGKKIGTEGHPKIDKNRKNK